MGRRELLGMSELPMDEASEAVNALLQELKSLVTFYIRSRHLVPAQVQEALGLFLYTLLVVNRQEEANDGLPACWLLEVRDPKGPRWSDKG